MVGSVKFKSHGLMVQLLESAAFQFWGSGFKVPASHVKFQAIASYHKSETSNTFHSFL